MVFHQVNFHLTQNHENNPPPYFSMVLEEGGGVFSRNWNDVFNRFGFTNPENEQSREPCLLGGPDLILCLASAGNFNNNGSRKRFWESGTLFLPDPCAGFRSNFSFAASRCFSKE